MHEHSDWTIGLWVATGETHLAGNITLSLSKEEINLDHTKPPRLKSRHSNEPLQQIHENVDACKGPQFSSSIVNIIRIVILFAD